MNIYAPTWAFSAQALDSAGDPHLAKGVHLRMQPGAALGLPMFPFRVYRVNLGQPGASARFRSDGVRFVDTQHKTLSLPFTVSANNPVAAYLPPPAHSVCCWIEITVEGTPGGLRAEAQVAGERGMTTLATATTARFQMAAARIDRVLLTGNAVITGVRWVDGYPLTRTMRSDLWRVLSLPLGGSARYTPTLTALADAVERVKRGAPLRQPMYKAPGTASPAQAPLIANSPQAEQLRIDAASAHPKTWLAGLVAGGSTAPAQRRAQSKTNTPKPVDMAMSLLDSLWLSTMDPGLSRWVGFGDVDEAAVGNAGDVVAYVVKGIWQSGMGKAPTSVLQEYLAAGKIDTLAALDMDKELALANPPLAQPPFYDLCTVACATLGKPGQAPVAPVIESFEYRPFLPALPPLARREVVLCAKGFAPGPGAALSRVMGNVAVTLNPTIKGQPVALLVSNPQVIVEPSSDEPGGAGPGRGRISDRQAPAEAPIYRLAQADIFGRWSPWSEKKADAAERPKPPQPVLQVSYAPPDAALWTQGGPLKGTFTVVVPVPANDTLAPGSWPLDKLKIMVGITPVIAAVASANPQGNLVLTVPGPALAACASTTVTVTATWLNTQNQPSDETLPVVRKIHDPRAPEAVKLNYALGYASRPDATGKARIDLRWPAAGAQSRFRVYYASETSLLSRLKASHPVLADTIQKTAALPERAQKLKDKKAMFDRDWFELLNREPLERGAAAEMRLVHEVSGKLATLGLYRVASVSAANVEGAFNDTPLVAYTVPNTAPPTMPLLEVALNPATGAARLTLRVPRGNVAAAHYRLRRSAGSASDASLMRVVQEGAVGAAAVDDSMQTCSMDDTGLQAWRRYTWRAEVRGADLPGSSLKGAWSRPSAAVEAVVIPPNAPAPVSQLQLNIVAKTVTVVFHHNPALLNGGSVGRFRLDLYKHVPGGHETLVTQLWADAPAAKGGFNAQGQASIADPLPAPPGTVYRVIVADPMGRVSVSNPMATVPAGA